jgi:hypothetical protein
MPTAPRLLAVTKGPKPVHSRLLRALRAFALSSAALVGYAAPANAGPKDREAEKLLKQAMDDDYLATDFAKAEAKLKSAVKACGSSGCSADLLGRVHVALGTVYGVGLSKSSDAKDEFVAALKADPNAALDKSLTTPELQRIYDEAKKGAGGGTPKPPPSPSTDTSGYTPTPETPVNTPIPIYVEPDDAVPLSKVILRYKPFGATEFKAVELKKLGKGWGGLIPCEDATTTGDVKFFFAFTGTDGEAAGGLGSSKEPFKTTIKNEIDGAPPKLPGKKAPEVCKAKEDCPPGLEGCPDAKGGKHGDKGWGASCDKSEECKEGLACVNGTCEESKGGGDDGKPEDTTKKRMNLIGLGVQFDFMHLGSTNTACDGTDNAYVCYLPNSNNQFYGLPVDGFKSTNGISGGGAFAGVRILVGYDRQLSRNVPVSLGVRIGYAFGGPKSPDNATQFLANGGVPPQPIAKGFLPFHGEARFSYHFLGSMMDDKKFRPYVFAGGGVGDVNASVGVAVCDRNETNPYDPDSKTNCGVPGVSAVLRQVNAYQLSGQGFVDLGLGTTFGITPLFGVYAEVKMMFMLPTFAFVASPSLGPVFNF